MYYTKINIRLISPKKLTTVVLNLSLCLRKHNTLKACGGVDDYITTFFILTAEKCHMSALFSSSFTLREIFLFGQCVGG
jgi:hypothetical protein